MCLITESPIRSIVVVCVNDVHTELFIRDHVTAKGYVRRLSGEILILTLTLTLTLNPKPKN